MGWPDTKLMRTPLRLIDAAERLMTRANLFFRRQDAMVADRERRVNWRQLRCSAKTVLGESRLCRRRDARGLF